MKYTAVQYAIALHQAVFESAVADQEKVLDNFVAILKDNGDLGRVDEIEGEFFKYERDCQGIKEAHVISARKLTDREEGEIIRELNRYVNGQVELKKQIDEGLVGGIMVKIGDVLIDGSVRKSLKELRDQLVKP
jgi:F-type H+-transporting ATPase subunit delta